MIMKKGLTILITASILFLIIPLRSTPAPGVYDPWVDTNDDGIINYQDLYNLAVVYGTSGTPINKTDLLLELQARISTLEAQVAALEAPGSVTTERIADEAIITAKLADGSVTTAKILDGTITAEDLADGSVTTIKIANGAVTTSKIANGAVTTEKIANEAVVTIKLADGSVTSAKILDGTVTTADLTNGAVTSIKIANGAVTTAKIADRAVTNIKLAAGAIPYASTYDTISQDTTTVYSSWDDMPGMSVDITLDRTSHVLIMFGCSSYLSASGSYIFVRALVDSLTANPSLYTLTRVTVANRDTGSYLFYSPSVSAGDYTVKIQWCVYDAGYTGYSVYRTLTVIALPA